MGPNARSTFFIDAKRDQDDGLFYFQYNQLFWQFYPLPITEAYYSLLKFTQPGDKIMST
jgi:hypothetical protein